MSELLCTARVWHISRQEERELAFICQWNGKPAKTADGVTFGVMTNARIDGDYICVDVVNADEWEPPRLPSGMWTSTLQDEKNTEPEADDPVYVERK